MASMVAGQEATMSGARAHNGHDSWNSSEVVSRTTLVTFLSAHTTDLLQILAGGRHFPDHWLLSPLGLSHRETFNKLGQIPAFPSGTEKPHRSKAGTPSPSTPPHTV